ncbi:MAG TPA: zinc ABC transporter substrate-binding protein [Thermomicrobiales bacterium]|nr:zinc ABC transporter substrate-binding protein [Thermomicrobiales bacterium]
MGTGQLTRRRFIAGSGIALAAIASGTTSLQSAAADDATIKATITTGMIADGVRNVGGDLVEATALMGPGIDPHLYKPTAGDINRLSDADIILYNGLQLEGRMGDTLEGISRSGKPVVAVAEAVPEEDRLASQDYEDQYDPHVWFDVSLWKHVVEEITAALSELSPDHAETFRSNADEYQAQLDELDAYVMEQAERVPQEQRVLVTAHDAFGYFGDRYGFDVRGLQGLSTATEAGAKDIQEMADFIAASEIRAIFVESSVPPATIEALQAACQAKGWDVAIGGELFSDAMGDEGTEEGTYIGMVRHNIDTIVPALLGEAS